MLTHLTIDNFKNHKHTELDLSNLTVLTGMNSAGKSSIIQTLLLLRQSANENLLDEGLRLQGDLCNIGLAGEAMCKYAENDNIEFCFKDEQTEYRWSFLYRDSESTKDFLVRNNKLSTKDDLRNSLFSKNFQYISAYRLAPQESYPLDTNAVENKNQISNKYGQCELVVHFLDCYKSKNFQVNSLLLHPNEKSLDILDQVSAWENEISKGVKVKPENSGKSYTLKYSYANSNVGISDEYSATNVGFGLSFALPIIVALLTASPGSLIIIENPEAHLHPSGQSALANLMSRAAQMGAQIIVETHSDHIINGILVATKEFENNEGKIGINKDNVKIYYLDKDEATHVAKTCCIKLIGDGKLEFQPNGFFDQIDKDLKIIMGF